PRRGREVGGHLIRGPQRVDLSAGTLLPGSDRRHAGLPSGQSRDRHVHPVADTDALPGTGARGSDRALGHAGDARGTALAPEYDKGRHREVAPFVLALVARGGVEPPTFRFSVGRSYQLSYLAETITCDAPGSGSLNLSLVRSDPDGTRTRDLRRDRAAR